MELMVSFPPVLLLLLDSDMFGGDFEDDGDVGDVWSLEFGC